MSVKVKISYERPEELHIVLKQLLSHTRFPESRKDNLGGLMLIWGMLGRR